MKFAFYPAHLGTHIRTADGVRGHLRQIDEVAVKVLGPELLDSAEGFELLPTSPGPIPEVSPRQIRLAMIQAGHDPDEILAFIETLPEAQRKAAFVEWEYANVIERNHWMVVAVMEALEIDSAEVDELFRQAITL